MAAARNADGLTLDQWMHLVDQAVRKESGVSVHDLPDACHWDAWNDCQDPADWAEECLTEDGFPFD